jgi:hypothetical protein
MQSIGYRAKTLMLDSVFVDSNVLLYSFDSRDPARRDQARHWLDYFVAHRPGPNELASAA